jgi:hypothetical protein
MRGLLILLLVASCEVTFEDFNVKRLDAICGYLVRCNVASSLEDCRDHHDYLKVVGALKGAVEEELVLYDPDAAQACLDAYANLSCDETMQPADALDACDGVYTGAIPNGGGCAFSGECESRVCTKPGCSEACCQGTCVAARVLPGVGEECTSVCTDDAYCGADSLCHALLPEGAACDQLSVCDRNLHCAGITSGGSGTCTALPHEGEPCDSACAEVSSQCVQGMCVRFALLGESCDAALRCSSFYACGSDGVCTHQPSLGERCTELCSGDAFCSGGTCVSRRAPGQECVFASDCKTFVCDGGTCVDNSECF